MKKKKKILIFGATLILIVFIIIMMFFMRKKDYSIKYKKDGYDIKESYNKKLGIYQFSLKNGDKLYEFTILSKQKKNKKLIQNVEAYEKEHFSCILLKSDKLNIYPNCYEGDDAISYSLVGDEDFEQFFKGEKPKFKKDKFDNVKINTLLGKSVAIWDNWGFMFISEDKKKSVDFLKNETYYDNLSYSNGRYVIIPDYDQKYSFDKYFTLDMKKGKISKWKLDEEISFNIYYLGTHDEKIYLIDRKNNKEFELNPKKKKMELESSKDGYGKVWNNKWESISMVKLVNNNYFFENDQPFEFILNDDKLYMRQYKSENDILITDKKVDKIVYINEDEVCYLVGDKLYHYSLRYGEVLMVTYSEWNFNKENPIYIY